MPAQSVEEWFGHGRIEQCLSRADSSDAVDERLGIDPLQDVPGGTRHDRRHECVLVGERSQDEHADGRPTVDDLPARLDTGAIRKANIHDHDVGGVVSDASYSLFGRPCFANHREVVVRVDERAQSTANNLVVVNENDPKQARGFLLSWHKLNLLHSAAEWPDPGPSSLPPWCSDSSHRPDSVTSLRARPPWPDRPTFRRSWQRRLR